MGGHFAPEFPNRLRKEVLTGSSAIEDRYYVDAAEYKDNQLVQVMHDHGRIAKSQSCDQNQHIGGILDGTKTYEGDHIISNSTLSQGGTTTFKADQGIIMNPEFQVATDKTYEAKIVTCPTSAWQYEYVLTDHLGNTRVVFKDDSGSPEIVSEHHYYPFGMSMAGDWENRYKQDFNYLYNKKEITKDFDWILYDYGARYYDPAIGCFISVDKMASVAPEWTPYRYGFNNPIRYKDIDGNFEMDPAQAAKYKRLAEYLKNSVQGVLGNRKILGGLRKYGNLNRSNVSEAVAWGSGPRIEVVKDLGALGKYKRGANVLRIDESIVKQLETASGEDLDAALLLVAATILHELTHYGELKDGKLYREDGVIYEAGWGFEQYAYGRIINSIDDAKDVIKEYNQRREGQKEESDKKGSAFNSLINNFDHLEEGTYSWNGSAWVKN